MVRNRRGFTPLEKPSDTVDNGNKVIKDGGLILPSKNKVRLTSLTGFTLIELMIIVTVLSILAIIALPKFAGMVQKAQEGRTKGNLGIFRSALNIYYADNDNYWPYTSVVRTMADGSGVISPSDWIFFEPEYLTEIPGVYSGQGGAWGNDHEGKNRICVAWAKNGSTQVVQDALAGLAHPEDGYEYLYYMCSSPTDGTGSLEAKVWINCQLTDSRNKKIIFW